MSLQATLAAIGIVLVATNVTTGITYAVRAGVEGVGYNSLQLRSSSLAAAAAKLPADSRVVSNDPSLVYRVSGRQPIFGGPGLMPLSTPDAPMRATMADGRVTYLAYFFQTPQTGVAVSIDRLRGEYLRQQGIVLRETARYSDGSLFTLTLGPGQAP